MKKILSIVFCLVSCWSVGNTQQGLLSDIESLTISVDPILGKYYKHQLKANQTIYRLGKFFQTSAFEIKALNGKGALETYQIGEEIKIPFNPRVLYAKKDIANLDMDYVYPVYYKAQTGDNLYRISSFYFDQELADIMEWNSLKSAEISLGQTLLIGWMITDKPRTRAKEEVAVFEKEIIRLKVAPSPKLKMDLSMVSLDADKKPKAKSHSAKAKSHSAKAKTPKEKEQKESIASENVPQDTLNIASKNKLYNKDETPDKIKSKKGIAVWNKEHKDQENLFVLHKSAKVNTIIELNYPLLKRKAFAKVVGNIPAGMYPDEVSLIISPKVAHSLGARDGRIMVEMKYYE